MDHRNRPALFDRFPFDPARSLHDARNDPHRTIHADGADMLNNGGVPVNELILSQGDVLQVAVNQKKDERPGRAPRRHGAPADPGGPGKQFSQQEVEHFYP